MVSEIRAFGNYGKVLGICLGFQSLYSYSYEGDCECLGFLEGEVRAFREESRESLGNTGLSDVGPAKPD